MSHVAHVCRPVFLFFLPCCCVAAPVRRRSRQDVGGWSWSLLLAVGIYILPTRLFCTVWAKVVPLLQTVWNMQRRRGALHFFDASCVHMKAWVVSPLSRLTRSCPHKNKLVAWESNNNNLLLLLLLLENPTMAAFRLLEKLLDALL